MTTSGGFTGFELPDESAFSSAIAPGTDGALWITESCCGHDSGDSIGRITVSGEIAEYRLPDPDALSGSNDWAGIAAGPDRALWFTQFHTGSIGRITTDGQITEFTHPGIGIPHQIVTGGGNLWFTDTSSVWRLTPTGKFTEFTR